MSGRKTNVYNLIVFKTAETKQKKIGGFSSIPMRPLTPLIIYLGKGSTGFKHPNGQEIGKKNSIVNRSRKNI